MYMDHQMMFMFMIYVFGKKKMTDALKDRKAQDKHV